jgi:hypothetical protein
MIITIEFTTSLSEKHSYAVREALSRLHRIPEKNTYQVDYNRVEAEALFRMLEYLRSMRRRRVFIDGQEMPWEQVFLWLPCYKRRMKDSQPCTYCSGTSPQICARNPWRCLQADMPLAYWGAEWLHFGFFDLDGTFIFDKTKIRHQLLANLEPYRFCPALSFENVLKILEAFPETANPRIDPCWKLAEPIDRRMAIVMAVEPEKKNFTGVRPASPRAAENLLARIDEKLSP